MKKAYVPLMDALRVTCPYGFKVDGVTANTSAAGHKGRYALDFGGASGATMDWLTNPTGAAPLKCVRAASGNVNPRMFATTEPVLGADGVIAPITLEIVHTRTTDLATLGVKVGAVFAAGQRFAREGTAGTSANHVHMQVARNNPTGSWHACASGYQLDGEMPLHRALFVPSDMKITGTGGYAWQVDNGEQPIGELQVSGSDYYRRTGPSTAAARVLADGAAWMAKAGQRLGVYEVRDGWARITQNGHWVSMQAGTYTAYTVDAGLQDMTLTAIPDAVAWKIWQVATAAGYGDSAHYKSAAHK